MVKRRLSLKRTFWIVGSMYRVALACGVTKQAVQQWKRCPADHVLTLVKLTRGKVKRHELRPDLYPRPKRKANG